MIGFRDKSGMEDAYQDEKRVDELLGQTKYKVVLSLLRLMSLLRGQRSNLATSL